MSQTTIRTPSGVTWDCSACGSCCRGYEFGPVSDGIVEGLKKLDIASVWKPAADQPWYEVRTGPDGQTMNYFSKVDDHCIFLQDDNYCAIHARFGAEAKPSFCREFPFHTVRDPTGLVAIVRADCAGFHRTFTGTSTIEQGAAEAAALPRIIRQRTFEPKSVDIYPGLDVGLDEWLDWEQQLLASLSEAAVAPEDGVAVLRAQLASLTERAEGARAAGRGKMAIRAVLSAFRMVLDKVLATDQSAGNPQQVAFAHQMSEWIDTALIQIDEPLPPLSDDAVAYLSVVLRSFVMARQWDAAGSVAAGLGRFLFHATVCRALADRNEAGEVTAEAWSARYVKWNRFVVNRTVDWTMGKASPAFVDLYRHGL